MMAIWVRLGANIVAFLLIQLLNWLESATRYFIEFAFAIDLDMESISIATGSIESLVSPPINIITSHLVKVISMNTEHLKLLDICCCPQLFCLLWKFFYFMLFVHCIHQSQRNCIVTPIKDCALGHFLPRDTLSHNVTSITATLRPLISRAVFPTALEAELIILAAVWCYAELGMHFSHRELWYVEHVPTRLFLSN